MRAARALLLLVCSMLAARAAAEGVRTLDGHGGPVMGLAVAPDGGSVLSASFDYSVGLHDMGGGAPRWLEGHRGAVNAVVFLGPGRAISAGDDQDILVWDLASGQPLHRMTGHTGKIVALRVSPDGRLVASAGWDRRAGLWDPWTGQHVRWFERHDGGVNDVAFSPDGASLYTAASDGTVRQWDIATGAELRTVVSHGFGVNRLLVEPSGAWLAFGAVDGHTQIIDLASGAVLADAMLNERPALALALSVGHRRLAVGYAHGYIMELATADWSALRAFRATNSGPVWALAYLPDGALLAAGLDAAIGVWPREGGEAPGPQRHAFHRAPAEMSNGERQFVRKCSICHTLADRADRKAGPPLGGVFGREAGGVAAYPYSEALARSDLVWNEDTIDLLFRDGPDLVVPGSKMPMQRITAPRDRDDLIDFLKQATNGP